MLPLTPAEILAHYGLEPAPSRAGLVGIRLGRFSLPFVHVPSFKYWPHVKSWLRANTVRGLLHLHAYRTLSRIYSWPWNKRLGASLIFIALGAFVAFYWPIIKLETGYWLKTTAMGFELLLQNTKSSLAARSDQVVNPESGQPQDGQETTADAEAASAKEFDPLLDPVGNPIEPVNRDFSLIVPKVGINATVIPGVNPVSRSGYLDALKKGIAHSSLSYYPNEAGTVYLFSHSTNYEWFIDDLNAIFYHLKNLEAGDLLVVFYQGNRYTYQIREKKIVSPREISYLVPQTGARTLILQTCWPPGSVAKRLLIFADLIDEKVYGKFSDVKV